MARIADKHGLTNRYRSPGNKRLVKRGRPRTRIISGGRKTHRSSVAPTPISTTALIIGALIVLVALMLLAPFFVIISPFVIFPLIMVVGDKHLQAYWNLPKGRFSGCASIGLMLLSSFEMIISFVCIIVHYVFEQSIAYLIFSILIYIVLTTLILLQKNRKLKNQQDLGEYQ